LTLLKGSQRRAVKKRASTKTKEGGEGLDRQKKMWDKQDKGTREETDHYHQMKGGSNGRLPADVKKKERCHARKNNALKLGCSPGKSGEEHKEKPGNSIRPATKLLSKKNKNIKGGKKKPPPAKENFKRATQKGLPRRSNFVHRKDSLLKTNYVELRGKRGEWQV